MPLGPVARRTYESTHGLPPFERSMPASEDDDDVEISIRRTRGELVSALDDLARLAWHGVPGCDGASLSLMAIGEATTLAATHDSVRDLDTVQYDAGQGPCISAMREGRIFTVTDYATETRWPTVDPAFREAGVRSSLSLPLTDDGVTLGGLNMYSDKPSAFTEQSSQAAATFARQAVMLLGYLQQLHTERAAHAREHAIAATLQRSLLSTLPQIAGLCSAARYLVSSEHAKIGGDWYDLFAIPDGSYGVAIGDVMGHDVGAAAAMGQLRSVLRSYAYEGVAPPVVLDRLDTLVQGFDMAELATCFYGQLELHADGATLRYSNAGHLPPLVRRPDGWVDLLDAGASTLIGVQPTNNPDRTEGVVTLDPGAMLVLYTDGLIETRTSDIDDRIDSLRGFVAGLRVGLTAEQVCDALVTTFGTTPQDDDIAVLVVIIEGPGSPAEHDCPLLLEVLS